MGLPLPLSPPPPSLHSNFPSLPSSFFPLPSLPSLPFLPSSSLLSPASCSCCWVYYNSHYDGAFIFKRSFDLVDNWLSLSLSPLSLLSPYIRQKKKPPNQTTLNIILKKRREEEKRKRKEDPYSIHLNRSKIEFLMKIRSHQSSKI